jgi:hypothetical protein
VEEEVVDAFSDEEKDLNIILNLSVIDRRKGLLYLLRQRCYPRQQKSSH